MEQYNLTEEELKKVQKVHVELLAEVDRICRKHRIHYNMVGGTMLGAIRHRGHIPWDDDADLGFLRAESEKFRKVCKEELDSEKFYFQDIRDTPGYRWGYGKLRRKGTTFLRLHQEEMPYEQGIFIDLFPMDNVPDAPVLRQIHFALCFLLRKFLWSEIGRKADRSFLKRRVYALMSRVPRETLLHWYEGLIRWTVGRRTEMVRILTFPAPRGTYGFYRKWFLTQSRYPFSTITLTGARDYDGYLKHKFGDYHALPPESERKVHPVSKLVLPEDA